MIEELRLLARGVFVVDRGGRIQDIQLVRELTEEPQPLLVANDYRFLGYV
ncbi:MAG: hypothetical protein JSW35_07790 [Deltaproteobacteria bacterium]|nr:MAG: hypothetical protein JSW35_07790 [Deltaproteobacteria bacterium]